MPCQDLVSMTPCIISKSDIQLTGHILGEGSFAVVILANYKSKKVAVKVFKGASVKREIIIEMETVWKIHHKNIIKLSGYMNDGFENNISLVFEFMEKGSVISYVKTESRTEKDLIRITFDIASGMEHLHANSLIHRDLAARNILISRDGTAKVADFGLCRTNKENGNSTIKTFTENQILPLRWCPKECIQSFVTDGKFPNLFSKASDMWSYGVTLWEVWTLGKVPYGNFHNKEIIFLIDYDKCPLDYEIPECPAAIISILKKAFSIERNLRPTFSEVICELLESKNDPNLDNTCLKNSIIAQQGNKQILSTKPILKIKSNENFVGRQKVLEQLNTYVKKGKTNILIRGPRGVGKTELAKEFARSLQRSTNISCSILNGKSVEDFEKSLQLIKINYSSNTNLEKMQPLDIFKRILELLPNNSLAMKWLVIIDNLTCKELENSILKPVLKYFSNEEQTNSLICIITASNLDINFLTDVVKLDQLTIEESLELFRNHKIDNPSISSSVSQNDKIDHLTKLAFKLGNLPLAIKQTISYIKLQQTWEELYCASDILSELEINPKKILDHEPEQIELATDTTIYQAIVSSIDNLNKASQDLLNILAFINTTISIDSLSKLLASIAFADLNTSLKRLKIYFLVDIGDCTITINPIIQLVVRLNFANTQKKLVLQFLKISTIESLDNITILHYMTLIRHAIPLYGKIEMEEEYNFSILLLKKLIDLNLYEKAYDYLEKVFTKNTNWVFKTDISEINLIRYLLEIKLKILNLKVVEKSLRDEFAVIQKNPDKFYLISICYKTLGKCFYYQNKFGKAENHYKKALETYLQCDYPNRETVQLQVNIANCLKRQEKFIEAMELSEIALSWQEEQVKQNKIPAKDALRTRHSIAHCLQAQSQKETVEKSLKMLKNAKEMFEKIFNEGTKEYGKDCPQFFPTMYMIAKVSNRLGENSEKVLYILNTLLDYQTKIKTQETGEILKTERLIAKIKGEQKCKPDSNESHKQLVKVNSRTVTSPLGQNINSASFQSSSERIVSDQRPFKTIRNEIHNLQTICSGILKSVHEIKIRTNQIEKKVKDALKSLDIVDKLIDNK